MRLIPGVTLIEIPDWRGKIHLFLQAATGLQVNNNGRITGWGRLIY